MKFGKYNNFIMISNQITEEGFYENSSMVF